MTESLTNAVKRMALSPGPTLFKCRSTSRVDNPVQRIHQAELSVGSICRQLSRWAILKRKSCIAFHAGDKTKDCSDNSDTTTLCTHVEVKSRTPSSSCRKKKRIYRILERSKLNRSLAHLFLMRKRASKSRVYANKRTRGTMRVHKMRTMQHIAYYMCGSYDVRGCVSHGKKPKC